MKKPRKSRSIASVEKAISPHAASCGLIPADIPKALLWVRRRIRFDELLSDWKSQGKHFPDWQWWLSNPAAYPKRGMTVQYRESDLTFLKHLLAEEGLFCWFEHKADTGDSLGSHTLVISDHNGVFIDNAQARIRYTQAGATLASTAGMACVSSTPARARRAVGITARSRTSRRTPPTASAY
ncbi:contractile injection system protein, VgrG/Pvc8 family [Dechloromonas denitrificans]|uniref:contractile injection system protein, VgrG/Pvc8 family n=1 Tax=Dechloromonas denitrificans TaxID=281362 RepID=UPI0009FB1AA3